MGFFRFSNMIVKIDQIDFLTIDNRIIRLVMKDRYKVEEKFYRKSSLQKRFDECLRLLNEISEERISV